jgi:hypothetical protein
VLDFESKFIHGAIWLPLGGDEAIKALQVAVAGCLDVDRERVGKGNDVRQAGSFIVYVGFDFSFDFDVGDHFQVFLACFCSVGGA